MSDARSMKYIPEKERKFTDEIVVKTYQSLTHSDFNLPDDRILAWMTLDQRIVLPVKEKIRRQFSTPGSIIVIVMLAGRLNYTDSFGFKRKLHKGTLLAMSNQDGTYEYLIKNPLSHTDAEFIEIEMDSETTYVGLSYLNEGGLPRKNDFCRINNPSKVNMFAGEFVKGAVYQMQEPSDYLILFVIRGEAWVNGLSMTTMDTFLIDYQTELNMEFTKDSFVLLFNFCLS